MVPLIWRAPALGALGAALAAGGCATPVDNYLPATVAVAEPAVGAVSTAAVGDAMLRGGQDDVQDAIQLDEPVTLGRLATYSLGAGHYVKRGRTSRGEFFNISGLPGSGRVSAGSFANPYSSLLLKPDGTLCVVDLGGRTACRAGIALRRIQVRAPGALGVQQALVYRGGDAGRLSVGYRELSGALPRPERSEDVSYDLRQSDIVGYKGARLQVLKATSEYVTYRVVRSFGPVELAQAQPAAVVAPAAASPAPVAQSAPSAVDARAAQPATVLPPAKPASRARAPAVLAAGRPWGRVVQVASSPSREDADAVLGRVAGPLARGVTTRIEPAVVNGRTYYRATVAGLGSAEEAEALCRSIRVNDCWIR